MADGNAATCSIVVDYVINLVARREIGVGDRLPPERDLAKKLDVSRPTVREAMKVLNYLGFVDSTQGSGNYITDTYDRTTASIMKVMYQRGDVDFQGFTVFRQMLELQSLELAVDRITEEQLREMDQIVDLLALTRDDSLIVKLDNRFHTILAEASGNPLILINFSALSSVIEDYMFGTYHQTVSKKKKGFEQLVEFHRDIVKALRSKNLKDGQQAMRSHFSWLS